MKKKFGKFLSILLTAVMLVGMLPATAFADDRTVVSNVVAESDSDMTPKYGKQTAYHTFTVTEGQPAWLTGNDWWKLIDGVWKQMEDGDTFGEGTYRYRAQLRIDDKNFDGKDKTTHVLAKEGLTLEVDEKDWDMLGSVTVGDGDASVSYVRVCSQPFNVEAPEGQGLKFYDSGTFDIGRNYVGRAITPYSVAGYVEGGTQPYTFSKVSGPAWIAVSATGEISGTPTAAGENADLVVQVTDSNSAAKTITIEVADTKINPDDRTEISAVTATSDIKPEYGEQATNPTFTVTEGKPAWLTGNDWWKMVDGEWTEMEDGDTFGEGTYRYRAQLRIDSEKFDGDDGTTHVLAKEGLTLKVDEKDWEVGSVSIYDDVSYVRVFSPAFTVKKSIVALDVKGIIPPVDGETADTSTITINNGNGITVSEAKWKKGDASLVDKFEANETYYLHINYAVDDDYTVAEDAEVLYDLTGGTAEHNASVKTIVIAYKVPETYAVTVETDGNGTASASPAKAAAGTTVTLTATPDEGYELDKWEIISPVAFKLPNNSFTMPDNDVTVKATFKAKAAVTAIDTINIKGITAPAADKSPVTDGITTDTTGVDLKTIQWEKSGGGIMDSADKFEVGQTYTLYISYEPQSGYEISNTVTVTSDLENSNVNATSARVNIQYTVPEAATYTVAVTDGTARQVSPVGGEYATTIETKAGNQILLKADDKEGKVFTGWSGLDGITLYGDGATEKDDPLHFIMPEKNVTVTANYIDESAETVIKNIDVTGITTPLAGATPKVSGITINTERVRLDWAAWNYKGAYLGFDDTFEKGEKYCLYVFLKLDEGYSVANDVTITADIDYDNAFVRGNVVYIYYTVKDEAPASYTVTVTTEGSGTASANPAAAEAGATVTLTAAAAEGYEFDRWEVTHAPDSVYVAIADNMFTMPAGDVTIKAYFREKAAEPECDHADKELDFDAEGHWYICPDCSELEKVVEAHEYDDDTDATCDCGYTREIGGDDVVEHTHAYGEDYAHNSTYHWKECVSADCDDRDGSVTDRAKHDFGGDRTCDTCGYRKPASSSGSSGSTKYKVNVEDTDNGIVESSRDKASKGTLVTITTDPDAGYGVDEITVTTKGGKEIEVTDKGDGVFTFRMPSSNVTVSADFVKVAADDDVQAEKEYILLTIDSVIARVFGEYTANDVAPVIRNGRTMLPARFVVEALGGVVTWDEAEQKVTIVKEGSVIEIFIGEPFATVDGEPVELDCAAYIENDRTYLPIRFIAENLGAEVVWDAVQRTVTITP